MNYQIIHILPERVTKIKIERGTWRGRRKEREDETKKKEIQKKEHTDAE